MLKHSVSIVLLVTPATIEGHQPLLFFLRFLNSGALDMILPELGN